MKSGILNIETSLLLLIDIQEKLLKAQFHKETIVNKAVILAKAARVLDIPVLVSEQYPQGLGSTVAEIRNELPQNTKFFEKTSFNCCLESGFNELIQSYDKSLSDEKARNSHPEFISGSQDRAIPKQVRNDATISNCRIGSKKQILICGMETHICVHQTVHELISQGYEVHLIQDAITSRKEEEYKHGLTRMINYGAIPSTVETALFELIKCTRHPQFKTIQNLIK